MPSQLTYPGVYIEELPSGVRTVTGVATSITAFVGYTAQGPVDKAVQVFNFGEFTREFGGLHRDSDVSYAIQQFFLNGGSNALVVRVAQNAASARVQMGWGGGVALEAQARTPGEWGNALRIDVDYATTSPASHFNLTVTRVDPLGAVVEREEFRNLSMNSQSAAYAVGVVNAGSRLVTLTRPGALTFPNAVADRGFSVGSRDVSPVPAGPVLSGPTRLTGTLNGTRTFDLQITAPGTNNLNDLISAINAAILAQSLNTFMTAIRADADGTDNAAAGEFVKLRSISIGADPSTENERSSVVIRPAPLNDASVVLGLGVSQGGIEREGAATRRPVATGTSGGPVTALMNAAVTVAIDEQTPSGTPTSLFSGPTGTVTAAAGDVIGARDALQAAIRALAHPAAQGAVVQMQGTALRVVASDAFPNVTFTLTGLAPLNMPTAGDVDINVSRYSLGTSVAFAAQSGGVRGSDGIPPNGASYLGNPALKTGIHALLDVDLFNILCIPGTPRLIPAEQAPVIQAAIALCVAERAFFIIDPPTDATRTSIVGWATNLSTDRNAAIYYPRIMAADPLDDFRVRSMPASGAVAGVMARTDAERGVWKAPAGTDAVLRGTQGLVEVLTDMENGVLNQQGVNALRSFPVYGRVVWGARTRRGADQQADEYKYIPIRRLALYLEETLYRNTQWVVFEPNDEPLWAQIRLNVGAFMQDLFRRGAFQGSSPDKAFLVKCDGETTTQYDIDRGIVNILVAFAPLKPAEFVVIQIQQKAQIPA